MNSINIIICITQNKNNNHVYKLNSPSSMGYSQELMSRMRSILNDSLSQWRRLTVKKTMKNIGMNGTEECICEAIKRKQFVRNKIGRGLVGGYIESLGG